MAESKRLYEISSIRLTEASAGRRIVHFPDFTLGFLPASALLKTVSKGLSPVRLSVSKLEKLEGILPHVPWL